MTKQKRLKWASLGFSWVIPLTWASVHFHAIPADSATHQPCLSPPPLLTAQDTCTCLPPANTASSSARWTNSSYPGWTISPTIANKKTLSYNNHNNHDDIYSAVVYGASHMREFTVVHLGQSRSVPGGRQLVGQAVKLTLESDCRLL